MIFRFIAFVFAVLVSTLPGPFVASAMELTIGDLTIKHPVIRATQSGAKVTAGYMLITNNGDSEERLMMGHSKFSGMVHIHESKMENGIMKMNAVEQGLALPPGETVKLLPGGFHLMFMQLNAPIKEGTQHPVELMFKNAGKITVSFNARSIAETMQLKKEHSH